MTVASPADRQFPPWFFIINTLIIVVGISLLLAYVGISLTIQDAYPYDYGILLSGTEAFCFQPDVFEYNPLWLYPAPFYSAMCIPILLSQQVTLVIWMFVPFLMALALAGRRAVILIFPPLILHTILGQSTWLVVPLFAYALWVDHKSARGWHGLIAALVIFKPHIGGLALIWLWVKHRHNRAFIITSVVSIVLMVLPAFLMQPTWLVDWLSNGRSFKLVSMANLGMIPVALLDVGVGFEDALDIAPVLTDQLIIYGFGAVLALVLLWLLYWRRGTLTFYDWVLVFCLANPLMHDYDLIILLPFIGLFPKRLLLGLAVSIPVWIYAMMTGMYHASILITLVLLMSRLVVLDDYLDKCGAVVKW